jgi:hypothetical protein
MIAPRSISNDIESRRAGAANLVENSLRAVWPVEDEENNGGSGHYPLALDRFIPFLYGKNILHPVKIGQQGILEIQPKQSVRQDAIKSEPRESLSKVAHVHACIQMHGIEFELNRRNSPLRKHSRCAFKASQFVPFHIELQKFDRRHCYRCGDFINRAYLYLLRN